MRLFVVILLLVVLSLAGAVYALFLFWGEDLPTPKSLRDLAPSQNTVLLDREGEVLDEFFIENRSPLQLEQIPEVMRQAVLATEDRRFYRHWGVDFPGVFRAFLSNVFAGKIRQGASTITQQLARNLFLNQSQTLTRKLREAVLAIRLERSFSKDEILELYLNQIYFGEGAYGVEAAAERYFGKSCRDLALGEAAMLAGLPANPAAYSPLRHPEAARRRRNSVLRRMEEAGFIVRDSREQAEAAEPIPGSGRRYSSVAPYFAEMVRQELMDLYGATDVYRGGLTVYTTLDLRLQRAAAAALESQLEDIEAKHALVYRRSGGRAVRGDATLARGASTQYLQGALVALEPQTGAIRALIGGRSFEESNFNRAVQARRQPGSSFKPILMAEALKQGYKTNDILLDSPVTYRWGEQVWSPQNFHRDFNGPVTLRYVLMKSINVPSVRLLEAIGPRPVIAMAKELGISGDLPPQLSLALGTGEVSPLELTAAYATFADGGIRQEPFSIEKVEDRYGNVLLQHTLRPKEVLDERSAFLMVSLLRTVIDHGTGYPARHEYGFDAPAGGKTGTTDDYTDAWFVGFIPRLACGVWVGFDEKKSIGSRMTGAAAALPAWSAFMNQAVTIFGKEEFAPPDGLVNVATCERTGLLADPGCPRVVNDYFLPGTAPTRYCAVHAGLPPARTEERAPEPDAEEAPAPVP